MNKIFLFFVFAIAGVALHAQDYLMPDRPHLLPELAPFYHGVASGDPLSDRVIIWTRVTVNYDTTQVFADIDSSGVYNTFDSIVPVSWQMALDTGFTQIVNSGNLTTDSSVDFTVKVDVTGLQPNTWYFYRFNTGGVNSITGRTRTTPVGNVDSLRFAVFSCSDYQTGFFNAYHDIAHRNDIDVVIHLGDYYYEYKAGGSDYQGDTNRLHPLNHDAFTCADYRLWHSQYKLDPDVRAIFQEYPWIQIWDDHDVANNSWYSGAQNHDPATEGSWFVRKAEAFKAYYEWLPIRMNAPDNDTIIRRTFNWGNLVNLIMLDTRYEARDSSLGEGIPLNNPYMDDTARQMLGPAQLSWFKTQLSDTTAQWRIIGNQVMIAPLDAAIGGSGVALNGDQWDGYPAERKRVFDYIMQQRIPDVVFVTGDIHSSWANDLPHPDSTYNASTGAGSVATEFIGTSITSTASEVGLPVQIVQLSNPHVKYCNLTLRGYLLLDINKQRVQGDFIHMSTIASKTYTASDDAQWMNLDGNRFLSQAPAPLGPRNTNPPLLQVTAINNTMPADRMVIVTCFPNPTENEVAIQYYLYQPAKVDLNIYDMRGRLVSHKAEQETQPGLYSDKLYLDNLSAGTYLLSISDGSKTYTHKIVKR